MYRIDKSLSSTSKVTLRRSTSGRLIMMIICILISIFLMMNVGWTLHISPHAQTMPLLLTGIALFFLALPFIILKNNLPQRLVFDHDEQAVFLFDHKETVIDRAASLPYDKVRGLVLYSEVRRSNNHRYEMWVVAIEKLDQVRWKLGTYRKEEQARTYLNQLLSLTELPEVREDHARRSLHDSPQEGRGEEGRGEEGRGEEGREESTGASTEDSSKFDWNTQEEAGRWVIGSELFSSEDQARTGRFKVDDQVDEVKISWRRETSIGRTFGVWVTLISLAMISISLWWIGDTVCSILSVILGIIALISLQVILKTSRDMFVKITRSDLITKGAVKIFGQPNKVQLSLKDLHAVLFDFQNIVSLMVLRHHEFEAMSDFKEQQRGHDVDFMKMIHIAQVLHKIHRLDCVTLSAAEVLELEMLIQYYVYKMSDVELI